MGDKTFGVKVNDELYEKVQQLIESSPLNAKEWFEKAVTLVENNSVKTASIEHANDLQELEIHTVRIVELVNNMVLRSNYLRDNAIKDLAEKISQKEMIIEEYLEKVKSLTEQAELLKKYMDDVSKEKETLEVQLKESRNSNDNNVALINEYKEKIDFLSGSISKYQSFAEENEDLKKAFEAERRQQQSYLSEVMDLSDKQKEELKELHKQLKDQQTQFERNLERITEKMDYEKKSALLELERDYQNKLAEEQTEVNKEIRSLYNQVAELKSQLASLSIENEKKQNELEQLKKTAFKKDDKK